MASFAFAKDRSGGQASAPAQAPVDLPLAQRRAPDGSLSIATPADWSFLAGGGKVVYETDSHDTRDTATGDYYEGRGYNWVNFEGQSPNHPSETMREISSGELQELNRRR
jgi:hypothetical protein